MTGCSDLEDGIGGVSGVCWSLKVNIITSVGQVGSQVADGRMSSQWLLIAVAPCGRGRGLGKG